MNTILRLVALLCLGVCMITRAADDPETLTLEKLFRPGGVTHIAISPDGRRVAYSVAGYDSLKLGIVDLDSEAPTVIAPIGGPGIEVKYIPAVHSLSWFDSQRLVYSRSVEGTGQLGELRVIEADGKRDRLLVNAQDVAWESADGPRPRRVARWPQLVGFSPDQPNTLILEAEGNRAGWLNIWDPINRLPPIPRDYIIPTEYYSFDLAKNKLKRIEAQTEQGILFDWSGRARLRETERVAPLGRQELQIRKPEPDKRKPGPDKNWEDLDKWLGPATGGNFGYDDKTYPGPRSIPLGFDGDPDLLYFTSNVGRDTFGIYAIDLRTKERTNFVVEDDRFDLADFAQAKAYLTRYLTSELPESPLIFDRRQKLAGIRLRGVPSRTRWLEPKLARLQEQLNTRFPGRGVEILDWDLAVHRVAAVVSGPGDPGRFIVFEEGSPARVIEITERNSWLPQTLLNRSEMFEFTTSAGVRLTGSVTFPRQPLVPNPPLVVLCPDIPGWRNQGDFDRRAQALALSGFVVLNVDYRGISGMGRNHRDVIKTGFDLLPISDVRSAMEWLEKQVSFDRKRIAIVGEGFGGYLALRALELYPDEFRAGVSFDAPSDLAAWVTGAKPEVTGYGDYFGIQVAQRRSFFGTDQAKLEKISVQPKRDAIKQPVLAIQSSADWVAMQGAEIVKRLKARGVDAEYVELRSEGRERGETPRIMDSRGTHRIPGTTYFHFPHEPPPTLETDFDRLTFRRTPEIHKSINDFLTAHLYDFAVKVGAEKVVE
jgi:dienelactone hydrolase